MTRHSVSIVGDGITWSAPVRIDVCRSCYDEMERWQALAERGYMGGLKLCEACRARLERERDKS
jgi:hypothetical protein